MWLKVSVYLVVHLAAMAASSMVEVNIEVIDASEDKEGNKELLYNDIREPPFQRSTIIGDIDNRWTLPIPIVIGKNLDIHAKGIILRALDQFRLKTCIDFRDWKAEEYYISIEKKSGCYSYIGRAIPNGQVLSIGNGCEYIATVEHEFLHALGFYHEQSRYDRDDHVSIVWNNIIQGYESNFNKVPSDASTTQGTPYDYMSVMHYGQDAFTNGNGSTIITKDPTFQNVIGQRREMSNYDVQELNGLYECNSTVAFEMFCSFSEGNMCNMVRCSHGGSWELATAVAGGPSSDHTTLSSKGKVLNGEVGYFMHVNTGMGQDGASARLETQRMSPKRDCPIQCLQFYYHHSGNELDRLNIWIREFENEQDSTGSQRLIGRISGSQTSYWKLHHVSLDATKNFQIVFEVRKGTGNLTGGFSIDDINLYETECPHATLQIDEIEKVMNTSNGNFIYSPRHYSSEGYAFRFVAYVFPTRLGLFFQLLSGDNDDRLEWPALRRQVTFQVLDQRPNVQQQMSKQITFTTNERHTYSSGASYWRNPRESGNVAFVDENNQNVYQGVLYGFSNIASLEELQTGQFMKGGSLVLALDFKDLTPLVNGSSLPCLQRKSLNLTDHLTEEDKRPCSSTPPTSSPTTAGEIPLPPTKNPLPPTDDPLPPTKNPLPPTDGPLPPTDGPLPPTKNPLPPTKNPSPPPPTPSPSSPPPEPESTDESIFSASPAVIPSVTFIAMMMLMLMMR